MREHLPSELVDRDDRKQLASALRKLATGKLTNFAFEDLVPFRTQDAGVRAVADHAWYLYSDLHEHELRGEAALTREGRREVARWLLFLDTDVEYEWPDMRWARAALVPFNVLSLGAAGAAMRWWLARRGALDVWPFIRRSDLDVAMRRWPRR